MKRKNTGTIFIALGIVLSLLVAVFVYGKVQEAENLRSRVPANQKSVVIAVEDIPERSEIMARSLAKQALPDEAIPAGAATLIEDVVGKVTPIKILKGEVLNLDKLRAVNSKNTPSYDIEPGKVAFVFPVRVSPTTERLLLPTVNALRPGDRIDIIMSYQLLPADMPREQREEARQAFGANYLVARTVLQNLRIHNIGFFRDAEGKAPPEAQPDQRYITFVVTPEEALVLKWLKDSARFGYDIDFVLRSAGDQQMQDVPVVDVQYMREKYGFGR